MAVASELMRRLGVGRTPFEQPPWECHDCGEPIPGGQYHDCKGGTMPEAITREALRERERCISLIWENRGKCASNQAALALMAILQGDA